MQICEAFTVHKCSGGSQDQQVEWHWATALEDPTAKESGLYLMLKVKKPSNSIQVFAFIIIKINLSIV